MTQFLAVLETMWDWESMTSGAGYKEAPDFFRINADNFSGKRLYYFTGIKAGSLWCTNVCPELVSGPEQHGTPSVERVKRNITRWLTARVYQDGDTWHRLEEGAARCILVCGKIAQETFSKYRYHNREIDARVVYLPHPANRTWTTQTLLHAQMIIQERQGNCRLDLQKCSDVNGGMVLWVRELWGTIHQETPLL